ncbi:Clavaminate synthase-like protein, partial [Aspergillus aculeatinus CBS 121060]
ESVMRHSQDFFALPTETKERYGGDIRGLNRGYERLRAQNFEKQTQGDLKEGIYYSLDDPYVMARKLGQGPNKYPVEVTDPLAFQNIMDDGHAALTALAMGIMQIIARTLHLDEDVFYDFCEHPVAVLRLLHYPPQESEAADDERDTGAHTDFGDQKERL